MNFISFSDSMKMIEKLDIAPIGVEKIYLTDTLNRVLAEDIVAKENSCYGWICNYWERSRAWRA